MKKLVSLIAALAVTGCQIPKNSVVTSTATVLGIELAQNPQTQIYQAKLGYSRAEIAIIPTNRSATDEAGSAFNGAKDAVPVLMELRSGGFFSFSSDGLIYQRLAIGSEAVTQPGAAFMMAKDATGAISTNVSSALVAAFSGTAKVDSSTEASKRPLADAYTKSTNKLSFDSAVKEFGYDSFSAFLIDTSAGGKISSITAKLKSLGLIQ
jgi:hypothetical protein